MTDIIRIDKLSKSYFDGAGKELIILSESSTQFKKNETVSVVGTSGSGKSTLLNLLGGLDRPTSGTILFNSDNISEYSADELADWRNQRIGFIFQAHHLLPDFTALENTCIPGLIAGTPLQECQKRANELLIAVGLSDRLTHKPNQLSGGEQQRVAIARALVNSPELILADEPTGNLDHATGEIVGAMLQEVCQQQNTTLILVTHNTKLANQMDCQYRLFNGNLERIE